MSTKTKSAPKGLTASQVERLKAEGVLSVDNQLPDFTSGQPLELDKVQYVLNVTDAMVSVGDLMTHDGGRGLLIPPRSLVYLPHYAKVEDISRCIGLRAAITKAQSLKPIGNPEEELTEEDVTPRPPLSETLAQGEHLDTSTNPFDKVLDDMEKKEEELDKRVTGRSGRRSRR